MNVYGAGRNSARSPRAVKSSAIYGSGFFTVNAPRMSPAAKPVA